MKKNILLLSTVLLFSFFISYNAQSQNKRLTLEEAIETAKENSIEAYANKHMFRYAYWRHKAYQASYLPKVDVSSNLFNLNRSISKFQVLENNEWIDKWAETNSLNSDLGLSVSQLIPWTGGRISMASGLNRTDLLNGDPAAFRSTPIGISYHQPLFSYNEYKWEKILSPMDYEMAKKNYIKGVETVTSTAIDKFFNLLLAQETLKSTKSNRSKRDTLYLIAQGRYRMGTIDKADLMQMEQEYLMSVNKVTNDSLDLLIKQKDFSSFMGFKQGIKFDLIYSVVLPEIYINVEEAIQLAKNNGTEMLGFQKSLLESQQGLEQEKANNRFNADLNLNYGLTQQGTDLSQAYSDPRISQGVNVSLRIPVLDWGRRKGRVKMARSQLELREVQIRQDSIDFEQGFFLQVSQFNLLQDDFILRAKTDSISMIRFDITIKKYLKGQVDILKVNEVIASKDAAKRNYINAIRGFWTSYYGIRRTTLYDFVKKVDLVADFDKVADN
ncbi:TolC family protein [Bacteroidota bacterium]